MELTKKVTKRFEYENNGTKLEFSLVLGTGDVRKFLGCLREAVMDLEREMEPEPEVEEEIIK